jgi:hypothetical protein
MSAKVPAYPICGDPQHLSDLMGIQALSNQPPSHRDSFCEREKWRLWRRSESGLS